MMKKSIIIALFTAGVIAVFCYCSVSINKPEKTRVIKPAVLYMDEYVEGYGNLKYKNITYVTSKSGGYVSKYSVRVGDYVEKGQKIADFTETTAQTFSLPESAAGQLGELINMANQYGYQSNYTTDGEKVRDTELYATADGYICGFEAEAGETVGNGSNLVLISDRRSYEIDIDVRESVVASIVVGQKARISGDGFSGREFSGTVTKIADSAGQTVQSGYSDVTVKVTVEMENSGEGIRPGYSANVKILTAESAGATVLPPETIIMSDDKPCVFVLAGGAFEKKAVETGIENQCGIEIKSGVSDTDIVAMSPDKCKASARLAPMTLEDGND